MQPVKRQQTSVPPRQVDPWIQAGSMGFEVRRAHHPHAIARSVHGYLHANMFATIHSRQASFADAAQQGHGACRAVVKQSLWRPGAKVMHASPLKQQHCANCTSNRESALHKKHMSWLTHVLVVLYAF